MSYEFFVKTTNTARAGFEKSTPTGASFSAFRKFAKSVNISLVKEREELEHDKQEITEKYSPKLAGEKIAEREAVFNKIVSMKQDSLRKILDRLVTTKKSAIEQFTTEPPTDRQLRLIDSITRRDGKISDTEWNMVVSECSSNYQASAILRDLAEKHDKIYSIPFEPEQELKDLDFINVKLTKIIDRISERPVDVGYENAEFFAHDENRGVTYGVLNQLCEKFDSSSPAYVAETLVDLTDEADLTARLLEARGIAYRNKAQELFSEIVRVDSDIRNNGLNEDNLNRAEKLIAMVHTLYPNKSGSSVATRTPASIGSRISEQLKSSGSVTGESGGVS